MLKIDKVYFPAILVSNIKKLLQPEPVPIVKPLLRPILLVWTEQKIPIVFQPVS